MSYNTFHSYNPAIKKHPKPPISLARICELFSLLESNDDDGLSAEWDKVDLQALLHTWIFFTDPLEPPPRECMELAYNLFHLSGILTARAHVVCEGFPDADCISKLLAALRNFSQDLTFPHIFDYDTLTPLREEDIKLQALEDAIALLQSCALKLSRLTLIEAKSNHTDAILSFKVTETNSDLLHCNGIVIVDLLCMHLLHVFTTCFLNSCDIPSSLADNTVHVTSEGNSGNRFVLNTVAVKSFLARFAGVLRFTHLKNFAVKVEPSKDVDSNIRIEIAHLFAGNDMFDNLNMLQCLCPGACLHYRTCKFEFFSNISQVCYEYHPNYRRSPLPTIDEVRAVDTVHAAALLSSLSEIFPEITFVDETVAFNCGLNPFLVQNVTTSDDNGDGRWDDGILIKEQRTSAFRTENTLGKSLQDNNTLSCIVVSNLAHNPTPSTKRNSEHGPTTITARDVWRWVVVAEEVFLYDVYYGMFYQAKDPRTLIRDVYFKLNYDRALEYDASQTSFAKLPRPS